MTNSPMMPIFSFEEYLAIEDESGAGSRHEYVDGYVRAMAGGTAAHNLIAGALFSALRPAALAHGCVTFMEGRRLDLVRVASSSERSYYPDVMVVCDPLLDAAAERTPCFVAEVLSDSTASIDQIEKLAAYSELPSVLAYAIVSQSERRVVLHRRSADRFGLEVYGPGDVIRLDCPAVSFAVDDLYAGLLR